MIKAIKALFKPSEIIGDNYMSRWHLIPHNKFCNIYLHRYAGSDTDKHMHDHPWDSVSIKLKGEVIDVTPYRYPRAVISRDMIRKPVKKPMPWLWPVIRKAPDMHRIEIGSEGAWTIFITGAKVRDWYFYLNDGQRIHQKEYRMNGAGS